MSALVVLVSNKYILKYIQPLLFNESKHRVQYALSGPSVKLTTQSAPKGVGCHYNGNNPFHESILNWEKHITMHR